MLPDYDAYLESMRETAFTEAVLEAKNEEYEYPDWNWDDPALD